MTEAQFWDRLKFRLSAELAQMPEERLRVLRCRGLSPQTWLLDDDPPCILGRARLNAAGLEQPEWRFVIAVPEGLAFSGCAGWDALFPPDSVTGWCAVDPDNGRLVLVPAAAAARQPGSPALQFALAGAGDLVARLALLE